MKPMLLLVLLLVAGCATKPPLVTVRTVEVPGPIMIERVDCALTEHPKDVPTGKPSEVFDVAAQRGTLLEQAWSLLDAIRVLHGPLNDQCSTPHLPPSPTD